MARSLGVPTLRFPVLRDLAIALASLGLILWAVLPARAQQPLLNVSYDPTREFYKELNDAFAAERKAKGEPTPAIRMSHGGSGKQARSVIDGLNADIVALAMASDIDAIAAATKTLPLDWKKRLPHNSSPYLSTVIFVVRKGNPKGIKDWGDLAKPGTSVITPNPKTSGGARWNYLGAWAYGLEQFNGDEAKVREFVGRIYRNAPVLDTGARGSTTTFAQRGLGDVLIAWENEAFLALDEFGTDKFELVIPSLSVLAEPSVALVDGNVDAKGTRAVAEAYLQFLYSEKGQQLAAKHYYRPSKPELVPAEDLKRFPQLRLVDISTFGGWDKAQPVHFGDNGVFDQIYKPAR